MADITITNESTDDEENEYTSNLDIPDSDSLPDVDEEMYTFYEGSDGSLYSKSTGSNHNGAALWLQKRYLELKAYLDILLSVEDGSIVISDEIIKNSNIADETIEIGKLSEDVQDILLSITSQSSRDIGTFFYGNTAILLHPFRDLDALTVDGLRLKVQSSLFAYDGDTIILSAKEFLFTKNTRNLVKLISSSGLDHDEVPYQTFRMQLSGTPTALDNISFSIDGTSVAYSMSAGEDLTDVYNGLIDKLATIDSLHYINMYIEDSEIKIQSTEPDIEMTVTATLTDIGTEDLVMDFEEEIAYEDLYGSLEDTDVMLMEVTTNDTTIEDTIYLSNVADGLSGYIKNNLLSGEDDSPSLKQLGRASQCFYYNEEYSIVSSETTDDNTVITLGSDIKDYTESTIFRTTDAITGTLEVIIEKRGRSHKIVTSDSDYSLASVSLTANTDYILTAVDGTNFYTIAEYSPTTIRLYKGVRDLDTTDLSEVNVRMVEPSFMFDSSGDLLSGTYTIDLEDDHTDITLNIDSQEEHSIGQEIDLEYSSTLGYLTFAGSGGRVNIKSIPQKGVASAINHLKQNTEVRLETVVSYDETTSELTLQLEESYGTELYSGKYYGTLTISDDIRTLSDSYGGGAIPLTTILFTNAEDTTIATISDTLFLHFPESYTVSDTEVSFVLEYDRWSGTVLVDTDYSNGVS